MAKVSKRENIYVSDEEMLKQKKYMEDVRILQANKGLQYHIITYGCQMNVHDSEKLAGMLGYMGYEWTDNEMEADLILFNTCAVREHAEFRVYGNIGALKNLKQTNPNLLIGICGCMMQQKEIASFIQKRFPYVDMIFGTHNTHTFPEILYEALTSGNATLNVWDDEGKIVEDIPIQRREGSSAWVTIMYGCNNFCSYCIVPYVRGRERSRMPDDIISEVETLVKEGYKEVTLLGQNVNSYGKDLENGLSFASLLRKLNEVEGLYRIRFMTSHPKDLSDELIETMANCEKVCNQLHLPIQSGSNRILKKMNRNYTREHYMQLIEKIRGAIPNIGITTDIIVGFPEETEEDFQDTLSLMREVQFDSAFTFTYSKRTGTKAASIEKQVDEETKKDRLARLIKQQNSITKEINEEYKGKIVEVLVENISKKDADKLVGRSDTGKTIHFYGDQSLIGKICKVKIIQTKTWTLEGEKV